MTNRVKNRYNQYEKIKKDRKLMIKNDSLRFAEARRAALSENQEKIGIGTLGEKLLHRIIKFYIEPDPYHHEIPILGSVVDVFSEEEIFEIQTCAFTRLVPKLRRLLPEHKITVVYPLAAKKTLSWLDPETGELTPPRKSPKRERAQDALPELSAIKEFIGNENLTVVLLFLDVSEYKRLDGWDSSGKRGATKIDKIPNGITEVITLKSKEDYRALIPKGLPSEFVADEFYKTLYRKRRGAFFALRFLIYLGLVAERGRSGRAKLYKIT